MSLSKRIAILTLVVFGLTACTVRTAYNYADWYLGWQIDDYVELTDEQEQQFDQAVDNFFKWHRAVELPKYQARLAKLKQAVEQRDEQGLRQALDNLERIWLDSAQQAAPDIILLLSKLSPEQKRELIENLQQQQDKTHKKWRKEDQGSESERRQQRIERLEETLGELTEQQQNAYLMIASTYVDTTEMRIASREVWLDKFRTALSAGDSVDQLALYDLFTNVESYRSEEQIAASNQNQQKYFGFLAQQLPNLTEKQKKHVLGNLNDYLDDLEYLIQQQS